MICTGMCHIGAGRFAWKLFNRFVAICKLPDPSVTEAEMRQLQAETSFADDSAQRTSSISSPLNMVFLAISSICMGFEHDGQNDSVDSPALAIAS